VLAFLFVPHQLPAGWFEQGGTGDCSGMWRGYASLLESGKSLEEGQIRHGPEADAYLIAYSILFSVYIILREVVGPAFLLPFLQSRRETKGRGWRLFSVTGTLPALLLGGVAASGEPQVRPEGAWPIRVERLRRAMAYRLRQG